MIIAVTGTPGVGKTKLSKILSSIFSLNYVDFEALLIHNKLYKGYDEEAGSYIIDIERARDFFKNRSFKDSVLDGHNIVLVYPCNRIDKVILLRCSPYVLYERLVRKGFNRDKALENVQAEILDVIASDVYSKCDRVKVLEIDVSNGIESRYEKIISFIRGTIGHEAGDKVDWLTLLETNNDLNKFF